MSPKKQKEWISTLINDLESQFGDDSRSEAVKEAVMGELTKQPYCGNYLIYQFFDECSIVNQALIQIAMQEITDYDLI